MLTFGASSYAQDQTIKKENDIQVSLINFFWDCGIITSRGSTAYPTSQVNFNQIGVQFGGHLKIQFTKSFWQNSRTIPSKYYPNNASVGLVFDAPFYHKMFFLQSQVNFHHIFAGVNPYYSINCRVGLYLGKNNIKGKGMLSGGYEIIRAKDNPLDNAEVQYFSAGGSVWWRK